MPIICAIPCAIPLCCIIVLPTSNLSANPLVLADTSAQVTSPHYSLCNQLSAAAAAHAHITSSPQSLRTSPAALAHSYVSSSLHNRPSGIPLYSLNMPHHGTPSIFMPTCCVAQQPHTCCCRNSAARSLK
eukprot:c4834_g1_i1 orf=89-478(+)